MKNLPILHVGLHKTGTTTLQNHLFAKHSGLDYLGRPYPDRAFGRFIADLYTQDSLDFDKNELVRVAETVVRPRLCAKRPLALSEEFLSGDTFADRGVIAGRLRRLFGEARIVLTIRNQIAITKSEYLDRCRSRLYVDFDRWICDGIEDYPLRSLRLYDYWSLAETYAGLFGRENVGIFLFEEFIGNRQGFLEKLCGFVGIEADEAARHLAGKHDNPPHSQRLLTYKKLRALFGTGLSFSKMVPAPVNNAAQRFLDSGRAAKVEPSSQTVRRLEDLYRASNTRLMADYGLPLEAHGYPL